MAPLCKVPSGGKEGTISGGCFLLGRHHYWGHWSPSCISGAQWGPDLTAEGRDPGVGQRVLFLSWALSPRGRKGLRNWGGDRGWGGIYLLPMRPLQPLISCQHSGPGPLADWQVCGGGVWVPGPHLAVSAAPTPAQDALSCGGRAAPAVPQSSLCARRPPLYPVTSAPVRRPLGPSAGCGALWWTSSPPRPAQGLSRPWCSGALPAPPHRHPRCFLTHQRACTSQWPPGSLRTL